MNEKKDGVSIKEIESFAKNHKFEVFFCALFLLALLSGLFEIVFTKWVNILFLFAGSIGGVLLGTKGDKALRSAVHFVLKQEKTLQTVLAVIALVIALFFPIAIFLGVGFAGGRYLIQIASDLTTPH